MRAILLLVGEAGDEEGMRRDVLRSGDVMMMSVREAEGRGAGREMCMCVASNHLDHACRYNKIGAEGAASLARGLEKMTGLQTLDLS